MTPVTPNPKAKPAVPEHPQPRRCLEQQPIPVLVLANPSTFQRLGEGVGVEGRAVADGEEGLRVWVQAQRAARFWAFPRSDPGNLSRGGRPAPALTRGPAPSRRA